MDELVPNTDGCQQFAPNTFKKEKCRNCGKPWQEHLGIIEVQFVNGFQAKKNKEAEVKSNAEAEAKEKARSKAANKKRGSQAVEDQWLFEGTRDNKEAQDDESDDDMGFRMFSGAELGTAAAASKKQNDAPNTLKVVNLIDYNECNLAGESSDDDPEVVAEASSSSRQLSAPAGRDDAADEDNRHQVERRSSRSSPQLSEVEVLHMEIEHLRQLLETANEEKQIHIAIVQDEVAEKQKVIEDLQRDKEELQSLLDEERLKKSQATDSSQEVLEPVPSSGPSEAVGAGTHSRAVIEQQDQGTSTEPGRMESAPTPGPLVNAAVGEAQLVQVMETLRELRVNAENSLAWIKQRRSRMVSSPVGSMQKVPQIDSIGGAC